MADRTTTINNVQVTETELRAALKRLEGPQFVLRKDVEAGTYFNHSPNNEAGYVNWFAVTTGDSNYAFNCVRSDGVMSHTDPEAKCYPRTSFTDTGAK